MVYALFYIDIAIVALCVILLILVLAVIRKVYRKVGTADPLILGMLIFVVIGILGNYSP